MKAISPVNRFGLILLLGALTTAWGCESVSLIGRESVEPRYGDGRSIDRRGDYGRERYGSDRSRDQVFGTVQDVDGRRREIRVRTDDGRTAVVRYDSNTRVIDGRRDAGIDSLRSGDMVSIQLDRSSGGEQYADAIRVEDRRGSWWR
jgi:hypothetical protein